MSGCFAEVDRGSRLACELVGRAWKILYPLIGWSGQKRALTEAMIFFGKNGATPEVVRCSCDTSCWLPKRTIVGLLRGDTAEYECGLVGVPSSDTRTWRRRREIDKRSIEWSRGRCRDGRRPLSDSGCGVRELGIDRSRILYPLIGWCGL